MFLKNFAKIKPSIIAKEKKIDYANVIQNKGKESNIKRIEKEVKKRLAVINLVENLDDFELKSIKNLYTQIIKINKDFGIYEFSEIDFVYIKCVYDIFKDFID